VAVAEEAFDALGFSVSAGADIAIDDRSPIRRLVAPMMPKDAVARRRGELRVFMPTSLICSVPDSFASVEETIEVPGIRALDDDAVVEAEPSHAAEIDGASVADPPSPLARNPVRFS